MNDKLSGFRVVAGDRLEIPNVGAVPRFCHPVTARKLQGGYPGEVGLVMVRGAELEDASTPEPKLYPELDQHTQVSVGQSLEDRDGRAWVVSAAVGLRVFEAA